MPYRHETQRELIRSHWTARVWWLHLFICLDYSRALCAIIQRMSTTIDKDANEIISVAQCWARDGSVFCIDASDSKFNRAAMLATNRVDRIVDLHMTRREYDAIPATERATSFFDWQKSRAERPL